MPRPLRNVVASLVVALAIGLAPSFVNATIYKCKDGAGKIQYSGQPCEYGGKTLDIVDKNLGARTTQSEKCEQLLDETHKLATGPHPTDVNNLLRTRALNKEYELRCLGVVRSDAEKKRTTVMCPDGSFVAGTRCVMAPNGKFVGD